VHALLGHERIITAVRSVIIIRAVAHGARGQEIGEKIVIYKSHVRTLSQ